VNQVVLQAPSKSAIEEGSGAEWQPTVRRWRHAAGERHSLGVRGRAKPLAAVVDADSSMARAKVSPAPMVEPLVRS